MVVHWVCLKVASYQGTMVSSYWIISSQPKYLQIVIAPGLVWSEEVGQCHSTVLQGINNALFEKDRSSWFIHGVYIGSPHISSSVN